MQEYIMSFDSTQQALRAEMLLDYYDLDTDTRPTPKGITAGCALSIGFAVELFDQVTEIVIKENVQIKGIFVKTENEYERVFDSTIQG